MMTYLKLLLDTRQLVSQEWHDMFFASIQKLDPFLNKPITLKVSTSLHWEDQHNMLRFLQTKSL